MSSMIFACGLLISVHTQPDLILSSYYQQYYHCRLEKSSSTQQKGISDNSKIPEHFSATKKLWPVFTVDQLDSESY